MASLISPPALSPSSPISSRSFRASSASSPTLLILSAAASTALKNFPRMVFIGCVNAVPMPFAPVFTLPVKSENFFWE